MKTIGRVIVLIIAAIPIAAHSQTAFTSGVSLEQVVSIMPTPLGAIPLQPSGIGIVGSSLTYIPGNAAPRQTVQRTTVLTDISGNWSVTWSTAFQSSIPVITAKAIVSTGTQPISCETSSRSSTVASGFCRAAASAVVSLGALPLTVNTFGTPPSINTSVMLVGAEPTQ